MTATPPSSASRLNTFVAPVPDAKLMRRLVPINRWLNLHGLPLLRDLPGLRRLPGLAGLCDIRDIQIPDADQTRLRASLQAGQACFLAPNHPEFFTDWMIDKELSARFAPRLACWATHDIVNGMGAAMQRFWLRNNLIAQIPGSGGAAAKQHSVAWALQGHGVLLHPEGAVNWHADRIAPLYQGVAELALDAYSSLDEQAATQRVLVQPLLWKLRFIRDESAAIGKELAWTAKRLRLPLDRAQALPQQLQQILAALLAREAEAAGILLPEAPYFTRRRQFLATLAQQLDQLTPDSALSLPAPRRWQRAARESEDRERKQQLKQGLAAWERLNRVDETAYNQPLLAQEHIAECVKRIRQDYCRGTLRDTLNAYCPRPPGPRSLQLRVPEAIDVGRWLSEHPGADAQALTQHLRQLMQRDLDLLLQQLHQTRPYWTLPNPLYQAELSDA